MKAEQIGDYIKKLVKCQPKWLQVLFDSERVLFLVEDDMQVVIAMDKSLSQSLQERATKHIEAYIEKNPCEALSITRVH